MNLTEAKAGTLVVIERIAGDRSFLQRVTAIGLLEGTAAQVVRNDPGMPMLLYCRETLLALHRGSAARIEVRPV